MIDNKKNILDVAQRHFSEYGYGETSVSKIAEEAGVSKALVFWHFESKGGLFHNLIERFIQQCVIYLERERDSLDAKERVEKMIDAFREFIEEHQNFVRIFLIWFMRPRGKEQKGAKQLLKLYRQFQYILEDRLRDGIENGIFKQDINVEATALSILANLEGIFIQMCIDKEGKEKLDILYQTFKRNLFEGICSRI